MAQIAELKCPKCQAPMRSYERSGVTIERCSECGGVFLDRGELERLTQAEGDYLRRSTDDDREEWGGRRRRRRGFLDDLFDIG